MENFRLTNSPAITCNRLINFQLLNSLRNAQTRSHTIVHTCIRTCNYLIKMTKLNLSSWVPTYFELVSHLSCSHTLKNAHKTLTENSKNNCKYNKKSNEHSDSNFANKMMNSNAKCICLYLLLKKIIKFILKLAKNDK